MSELERPDPLERDHSRLTIAIPTYNRHEQLEITVRQLIRQMAGDCQLLIVDNASESSVTDMIERLVVEFDAHNIRVVRNQTNIGANANILRCMELCDTEWIWIVSDDDRIWDDAIANVLSEIIAHNDCAFVNFAQHAYPRTRSILTTGRTEFLKQIASNFYTLFFLSTTAYRVSAIRSSIIHGYSQIPSLAPHVAVMTMAAGKNEKVYFSAKTIVEYIPARDGGWSQFWVERGLPLLLDLPIEARDRNLLQSALRCRLRASGILAAYIDCIGYAVRSRDLGVGAQLFRLVMLRRVTVMNSFVQCIIIRALLMTLNAPRLAIKLAGRLYPMMKGTSFEERVRCVGISLDDRV